MVLGAGHVSDATHMTSQGLRSAVIIMHIGRHETIANPGKLNLVGIGIIVNNS